MLSSSKSIPGSRQQHGIQSRHGLAGLATRRTVQRQRRVWSHRVSSWDQHGSASLGAVTTTVLATAAVRPGDQVVDLGCGQGQISLPLARKGAEVLAIDVSPAMATQLARLARREGAHRVTAAAIPIEQLALPAASVDLVVSSYALHHLRDADKAQLVADAFRWLRPGGRLVLADMMFGRGGSRYDREIIRAETRPARRGRAQVDGGGSRRTPRGTCCGYRNARYPWPRGHRCWIALASLT